MFLNINLVQSSLTSLNLGILLA